MVRTSSLALSAEMAHSNLLVLTCILVHSASLARSSLIGSLGTPGTRIAHGCISRSHPLALTECLAGHDVVHSQPLALSLDMVHSSPSALATLLVFTPKYWHSRSSRLTQLLWCSHCSWLHSAFMVLTLVLVPALQHWRSRSPWAALTKTGARCSYGSRDYIGALLTFGSLMGFGAHALVGFTHHLWHSPIRRFTHFSGHAQALWFSLATFGPLIRFGCTHLSWPSQQTWFPLLFHGTLPHIGSHSSTLARTSYLVHARYLAPSEDMVHSRTLALFPALVHSSNLALA
jgi:hypothetical protein